MAAPIGLSPLLILTLCGSERVLVVSTEPPDDLSCLTTPGVGRPGDGLLPVPLTRGIQMGAHSASMLGLPQRVDAEQGLQGGKIGLKLGKGVGLPSPELGIPQPVSMGLLRQNVVWHAQVVTLGDVHVPQCTSCARSGLRRSGQCLHGQPTLQPTLLANRLLARPTDCAVGHYCHMRGGAVWRKAPRLLVAMRTGVLRE